MFSDEQLQTILFLCREHMSVRSFVVSLNPQFEPAVELEASIGSVMASVVAKMKTTQKEAQASQKAVQASKFIEDQKAATIPENGARVIVP